MYPDIETVRVTYYITIYINVGSKSVCGGGGSSKLNLQNCFCLHFECLYQLCIFLPKMEGVEPPPSSAWFKGLRYMNLLKSPTITEVYALYRGLFKSLVITDGALPFARSSSSC